MEDGLNLVLYENVCQFPDEVFQRLEREIIYLPEEQCQLLVKNKACAISRKIAAFGDADLCYTFSGLTVDAQGWSPLLLEIKSIVETLTSVDFNFVLINRYEDGNACIGQHKDDEPDLEENHPICSLSFGETRTMIFKRPNYKDRKMELPSNSLLVMNPPTNRIWSHGIPRQRKRTGVRINLTFRKMKKQVNKRKLDDGKMEENSKKVKKDETNGGIFKADKVPGEMVPIGDAVFVYPSTFRGDVNVHIRRFKKYGETFYPTKEGVTLRPFWVDFIMNRHSLPRNPDDLKGSIFLPEEQIKIHSTDFENFTFTRFITKQGGEVVMKSITLSSVQWTQMMKQYNDITTVVLDHIYGAMDFLSAYKLWEEGVIEECLPDSLDVSLGTQCLLELLRDSLSDCIKLYGDLKDPELLAEELWGNRVETFNYAASAVKIEDIAHSFYCKVWTEKDFLLLSKPALYVTKKFLRETRLQDLLREVRNTLCPSDAFEYYEDVKESMLCT